MIIDKKPEPNKDVKVHVMQKTTKKMGACIGMWDGESWRIHTPLGYAPTPIYLGSAWMGGEVMDVEIRRNRDLKFDCTCENPAALKGLFQMTDEQQRLQDEFDARRKKIEDEFWRFVKEHPTRDCNGELIKPETHEIGFDFGEPDDDGECEAKTMWVRPKKSEYEK